MGIEYRPQFIAPNADSVAALLRQLPSAQELTMPVHRFELRSETSVKGMPDAEVRVEPDGAYFCDYGGAGKRFLGIVVERFVSEFGTATIAEWE
jgi:hypothetical protein